VPRDEHDPFATLLVELRPLINRYQVPPGGCASYQPLYARLAADTHLHVHLENNLLFPATTTAPKRRPLNLPAPHHCSRPAAGVVALVTLTVIALAVVSTPGH